MKQIITGQMLLQAGLSKKESFLIRLKFPLGATAEQILKFAYNPELREHISQAIDKIKNIQNEDT